jgi:SNF2 family DNA or RNA helicase
MATQLVEKSELRGVLVRHFSLVELKDIAFDLDIDYEVLSHCDKLEFARELILYLDRRDRLGELIARVLDLRPSIAPRIAVPANAIGKTTGKVQVQVSEDSITVTKLTDDITLSAMISEGSISIIAAALGSLRVLLGLPQEGIELLEKGVAAGEAEFITAVTRFEELDEYSQRAWRLAATEQPPHVSEGILRPTAIWQDVIEFAEARYQYSDPGYSTARLLPSESVVSSYWPEPVGIITETRLADRSVTVEAVGLLTRKHYTTSLPVHIWQEIHKSRLFNFSFEAPAQQFRLAIEAERLRMAYTADPLLAANNSKVDLLPHQMEAVYSVMLPQPRIRHLMAHDAGAGKTIMGGLLYKELASREPNLRTLVLAPAALTKQWQRELREKFLVDFEIVDRNQLGNNGQVWLDSNRLITSIPFARQADVQATLVNVDWDLVIVDEAHHMAGYAKRETQAYRLGRTLSRNSRHLVLATATPHKGDPVNFLRLLQLLDEGISDPRIVLQRAPGERGNPIMLRRLKEEMVDFEGNPLFKKRIVETRLHTIGDNPPEMALYVALTEYVNETYRAAERLGGSAKVNTEFAMVILQRRMASSFFALEKSLRRRRGNLEQEAESSGEPLDWSELEDLPEDIRWKEEEQAELATPARTKHEREKEIALLDDLLGKLDAVRQSELETKVDALRTILSEIPIAPEEGEKLLVFTEFKDTLDFLRTLFESWGYTVTQIDGSMSQDERLQAEEDFHHRCQVMVATEAAGEGINLQFCAHMINYDIPWIPTRLEQRMGRIHRYGQERVAHIFNLTAADTREGRVLLGLMERLEEMRQHLGDQVFDVVSTLVGDLSMEKLLAEVVTSPLVEPAQDAALKELIRATEVGVARYKQWEENPYPISIEQYERLQQLSRQSRLTPEYAQHFFVDSLEELNESPVSVTDPSQPPGDAALFALAVQRANVARELGLPLKRRKVFTFLEAESGQSQDVQVLALGSAVFDNLLTAAETRWGETRQAGAKFIDVSLAPGGAYLLWFLSCQVRDGQDQVVEERLFAVKQTAEGLEGASAAFLIDLIPESDHHDVPQELLELARSPDAALKWSINHQQIDFLDEVQKHRSNISTLRREPWLHDARQAEEVATNAYNLRVFADDAAEAAKAESELERARDRVALLEQHFDHEAACSLGETRVIGVAAIFSLVEQPDEDLADEKPEIGAAAEMLARQYEEMQGRGVKDVSGEHDDYPYDLHSVGPGGVRCIEVKGTTTGQIKLSENQRRSARKLGKSYFLYIVRDPLGDQPRLTIVRDPLSKMDHDNILYSGTRYIYNSKTWQAAADEEAIL